MLRDRIGPPLLGRHFAVEAEVSRWAATTSWDDGTRRGWSGGGNLLYRSELRRVSWFAGEEPPSAANE
jgi:hypothetical protein